MTIKVNLNLNFLNFLWCQEMLKVFAIVSITRVTPYAEWFIQKLAGSADFPITATPDLLIVRYAPTLPICAVIINQLSVRDQCVMFVSPRHGYQVSANLKCLRRSATGGRR